MSTSTSTILITGGTLGLGYWTAFEIAKQSPSAKVIIASRSNKDNADQSVNQKLNRQQVEWMSLDLASTKAVREFVKSFTSRHEPISHLILNAGLQYWKGDIQYSPDGVEQTFAINHLGGSLLFFLLKPHLTPTARIIFTASGVHDPAQETPFTATYQSAELLARPTDNIPYNQNKQGGHRYAQSKLANVLFTYALNNRLKQARNQQTVAAFDPGLMPGTGLGRDLGPVILWIGTHILTRMMWLLRWFVKGGNAHLPQDSGRSQALLAGMAGEEAKNSSGTYWSGRNQIESSKDSHDVEKQEDLWRWTVDFLARDEQEKKAFETF